MDRYACTCGSMDIFRGAVYLCRASLNTLVLMFLLGKVQWFSEKLAPDTYYLVRVALRLMGVAASALDTGQFSLASFASFWKVSSSMPGTTASVSRSIGLMAKPPGTGLKCTRAVVCTLVGVKPALASAFDSAIE